jgi:plasmid stabilization system protein ParE
VIKKYKVKITATAERDIQYIWDYISHDNPQNAGVFITEIEEKIYGLNIFPDRNPIIPEGQILQTKEYRHLIYKNYRIIYRFNQEIVFILRIFHGSKLLDIAAME